MDDNFLECPNCHHPFHANLPKSVATHLAPTGKDYDWVAGYETITCPHCNNSFTSWVKRNLDGSYPVVSEAHLYYDPSWSYVRPLWSPDGRWLALDFRSEVRVYELDLPQRKEVFKLKKAELIGWNGNYLVAGIDKKYSGSHYQIWDITTATPLKTWNRKPDFVNYLQQEMVDLERGLIAQSGNLGHSQRFEIRDMNQNRACQKETGRLFTEVKPKTWFRLETNQVLCALSGLSCDRNILELWKFNLRTGNSRKTGKYFAGKATIEAALWTSEGTILLVEGHVNYEKACFYYTLSLLDGKNLALLKPGIRLPFELGGITALNSVHLTPDHLVFHTDKIQFLDRNIYEDQGSLPFPVKWCDSISVHPAGTHTAIGFSTLESDVVVIEHATNQGWSLKDQKSL